MRTYVRVVRGDDPARRPRRVLRVGRAARRSSPARAPGHRRRRGRARRELRGEGIRRPHGDGRGAGAAAVPARDRRAAADVRLLRGEQGGVRGFRRHDAARRGALDRRGVPRRPRAPAARRRAHRDRGAAPAEGSRAGRPPITVGIARTKFLAKVASGVAKPDGLLVVPPDDELGFLHPLPVERLWGVGRGHRRQAPQPRDHDRRPGRAARRAGARRDARPRVGPASACPRSQP